MMINQILLEYAAKIHPSTTATKKKKEIKTAVFKPSSSIPQLMIMLSWPAEMNLIEYW